MADLNWRGDRLHVSLEQWLTVLRREYLEDYLSFGGSAVKFVSGEPEVLSLIHESIEEMARGLNYHFAFLDAARIGADGKRPDLHRIERFFFEATGGVDWKQWAAEQARQYLDERGITVAPHRDLGDLDGIASDNGRDVRDLINGFQSGFATQLIKDRTLSVEFRSALTALCRSQVIPDSLTPTTEEVLLSWLRGSRIHGDLAALKAIQIFSRVDRSNARHLLVSFCRWLPRTGRSGLIVILDFRPYEKKRLTVAQKRNTAHQKLQEARARGATAEELYAIMDEVEIEPPVSYTDPAYVQMLELLRRFIDESEIFRGFCLVVLTSPSFYDTSELRNYTTYNAIQTRIGLEVRDANRANPAAALVHLGAPK